MTALEKACQALVARARDVDAAESHRDEALAKLKALVGVRETEAAIAACDELFESMDAYRKAVSALVEAFDVARREWEAREAGRKGQR
jgi:hypothetical protein